MGLCCISDDFLGCGRKICGFIICFLILGPAMVAVAIAMFVVAAKDPRGHHIASYNLVVDRWTGGQFEMFANLNSSFVVNDNNGSPHSMRNVSYPPDPIDDSGAKIHKYHNYLRYEYLGNILQTPTSSASDSITIMNLATGEDTTVGVKAFVTTTYTPSELRCTRKCSSTTSSSSSRNCYSANTCASYCHSRNGYYDYFWNLCYVVKYAEDVCVKVQDDGSFNHADNLCYGEAYGDWQPDPIGANGGVRQIPPITVTVRSASDPFITLYKLTGGDLWFGLSASQYAEIGIAFIVVGGFLCALVTALFLAVCYKGHCLGFNRF